FLSSMAARPTVPGRPPELPLGPPRRTRPTSVVGYKPPPLRFRLPHAVLDLPGVGPLPARSVEATVFDFAAVSVAFRADVRMAAGALTALAGRLSDPAAGRAVMQAGRAALSPLYQRLLPAVVKPHWKDDLWEEYFVL